MSGKEGTVRCPLCGATFPAEAACPSGCPMSKSCRTLCCPHCHYRFVNTSVVAGWLERLLGGVRP